MITGRSSGCCTRRTRSRSATSASARRKESPSAGTSSSRATSTSKGQFVVLTKDDFKTAALEKTKTIDIIDFVDPKEIDERYFETPYYLQAGKGGRPIVRAAARGDSRLGSDRHREGHPARRRSISPPSKRSATRWCSPMMRFADELADLGDFTFPRQGRHPSRRAEDGQAADRATSPPTWDPEKYTDEYKDNLMRVISAKVKGKRPKLIDDDHTPKQAEVVDLMARLRASLEGKKSAGSTRRSRRHLKRRKAARRPAAWRRLAVRRARGSGGS